MALKNHFDYTNRRKPRQLAWQSRKDAFFDIIQYVDIVRHYFATFILIFILLNEKLVIMPSEKRLRLDKTEILEQKIEAACISDGFDQVYGSGFTARGRGR